MKFLKGTCAIKSFIPYIINYVSVVQTPLRDIYQQRPVPTLTYNLT